MSRSLDCLKRAERGDKLNGIFLVYFYLMIPTVLDYRDKITESLLVLL